MSTERLPRVCPGCGYALAGLPAVGTCPECGSKYDDAYLVLPAWRASGTSPFTGLLVVAVALVGWVVVVGRFQWFPTVAAAVLIAWFATEGRRRLGTPWASPMALWLSADGVGVKVNGPVPTVRTRRWAAGGAVVAVAVARVADKPADACLVLSMAAVWGFLFWYQWPNRDRPLRRVPTTRPDGPDLIEWADVFDTVLVPCRGGRHRFDVNRTTIAGPRPVLRVEVRLAAVETAALADRIDRWRHPPRA